MLKEHGQNPNFDDNFLDNPPFNFEQRFDEPMYHGLCDIAANQIRLAPLNEGNISMLDLGLSKNSDASKIIENTKGTTYSIDGVRFFQLDIENFGMSYGFELLDGHDAPLNPKRVLRLAFTTTPSTMVYIFPEGFPMEDELLRSNHFDEQVYTLNQLLYKNNLPANEAGGVIFALRLIREFLQGKLLRPASKLPYRPIPQAKHLAESYKSPQNIPPAYDIPHPGQLLLPAPDELPDFNSLSDDELSKSWQEMVKRQLVEDIARIQTLYSQLYRQLACTPNMSAEERKLKAGKLERYRRRGLAKQKLLDSLQEKR